MMQPNNIPPFSFHELNEFHTIFPNPPPSPLLQEFTTQSSSCTLSANSTSDEAEEQHQLRKQRRMVSNRESARRSRMRRQKHLDELQSRVVLLWTENHNLLEENSRLREEVSDLRQMITELQIGSPYYSGLTDLEEVNCNTANLRAAL